MGKKDERGKLIRIALLGSASSGKTSICTRYVNNYFHSDYIPTAESLRYSKIMELQIGDEEAREIVLLQIEDVIAIDHPHLDSESEHFAKASDQYSKFLQNSFENSDKDKIYSIYESQYTVNVYFFVVEYNSTDSWEQIKEVIKYINTRENNEEGKKKTQRPLKFIVVNKRDSEILDEETREIANEAAKYACSVHYISSKYNTGVDSLFEKAAKDAYMAMQSQEGNTGSRRKRKRRNTVNGLTSFFGCAERGDEARCLLL